MPVHHSKRVYNPETKAYWTQKSRARERGIEFLFEFDEWIDWWGADFDKRGRGFDCLVMARYGDTGPYHPDNVYKCTVSENVRGPREHPEQASIESCETA
jgi:hypothetical protein